MPKFDFYRLDSSFIRNNRQTDTTTMMSIILLLFHWFFFLLFHVSCCLAGHQLSINEPFFRSTFFFVAIHRWLTNGDNSLCCLCCCCSFLIDIIVQKIVPSLHIFCAFDIFRQTFLFLIFFFDIFFFLFFLPSRRQWKCRNRKPKEGKTKIWPTFGISSGLVLFLSRQ